MTQASRDSVARLSALLANEEGEGAKAWEEVRMLRAELAAMRAAAADEAAAVAAAAEAAAEAEAATAAATVAATAVEGAADATASVTELVDEGSNGATLEQEPSVGEAEAEFTLNTPFKKNSEGEGAGGEEGTGGGEGAEGKGDGAIEFDSSYMFKDTEGDRIRVSQF